MSKGPKIYDKRFLKILKISNEVNRTNPGIHVHVSHVAWERILKIHTSTCSTSMFDQVIRS